MTPTRRARFTAQLLGARGTYQHSPPWPERLLHGLGAHPAFAEAVLGDLAEERARREWEEGTLAARWWYIREALRAVPHLLWNAVRHGGGRGRARVAAMVMAVAFVPAAALVARALREAPPARLVMDGQQGAATDDGIVLNTVHPVRLATRVLDAEGRPLPSSNVRYRWAGGAALAVTPNGVVTCLAAGDAKVRASIGDLTTTVPVQCRPVREIRATQGITFLLGDVGRDLRFVALDPDGQPVSRLAGEIRVEDSTIATLHGTLVRPVAPGHTGMSVHIGDGEAWTGVTVYEPVSSLVGLRADQRVVVAPVRLAPGETIRWPLPKGLFSVRYTPASRGQPSASLDVDGPLMCMPTLGATVHDANCLVRGPGATIRIAHPGGYASAIAGGLALEMWKNQ